MRRFMLHTIVLLAAPWTLAAQDVAPGFSRAQVEARLGPPAASRTVGDFTYLFYNNGCEIKCGQHDLVILRDDTVADAVFRSKKRHYTGQSSAPAGKAHSYTERTTPIEPAPPATVPAAQPAASLPAAAPVQAPATAPPRPSPGTTVFSPQQQKQATQPPPKNPPARPDSARSNTKPPRA